MSWPLIRLGEVCTTTQGVQITKAHTFTESYKGGYRYLYIADFVSDKKLSFVDDLHEHKKVTENDLVMANTGSPGRVFKGKTGILSNNLFKISFDLNEIDRDYLYFILSSNVFQITLQGQMKGGIQKHLGHQTIARQELPIPPLIEQKRIATILTKAYELVQKRQQAIKLKDELLKAIFLDMFGDPVINPKSWRTERIKYGVEVIKAGWSAMGANYPCDVDQRGVLKISAVTSGIFKPEENKFVDPTIIPKEKKLIFPNKGDLLFSRANTRELVAATCIVTKSRSDVFLPDKLWSIKTDIEKLLPEFLHFMVQQPKFKDRLTAQATGTSGSMLNISKAKFEDSIAIFPPIELQKKFRNIFWQVNKLTNLSNNSMENLTNNFNSLSQKAFAGEL